MAKIHMVLQGKGGVGKSVIAALIAQYKASKGQAPLCLDTDLLQSALSESRIVEENEVPIGSKLMD